MNKDLTEVYQIKVRGRPDARWSSWFGGMTITYEIESDGVPAVVGTGNATRRIPDGAWVTVDGTAGTVEIGT
jgi:hypothetical protein